MTRLEDEAARQRRALLARERRTQRELVRVYGEAFRRVRHELTAVVALLAEYQAEGRPPVEIQALMQREQRLEVFLEHARQELAGFILFAEPEITTLQREYAQAAIGNTYDLTRLALGTPPPGVGFEFRPPPVQVIARLVGNAGDGTPLGDVLHEVAGAQLHKARTELLVGVARGQNPREIGRRMARAVGDTATRSVVIARTESLRAYRQVTTETMTANPVITGWVWSSAADLRTCPACIAMTGQWFPADQTLDSHVNCRCSQVPQTKSWAELGFSGVPDTRPSVRTGEQILTGMTKADRRTLLGPSKAQAFDAGRITTRDLVVSTHSERWGAGRRAATLTEALARV